MNNEYHRDQSTFVPWLLSKCHFYERWHWLYWTLLSKGDPFRRRRQDFRPFRNRANRKRSRRRWYKTSQTSNIPTAAPFLLISVSNSLLSFWKRFLCVVPTHPSKFVTEEASTTIHGLISNISRYSTAPTIIMASRITSINCRQHKMISPNLIRESRLRAQKPMDTPREFRTKRVVQSKDLYCPVQSDHPIRTHTTIETNNLNRADRKDREKNVQR